MRLGLDFDNTIACYDKVFLNLAKQWQLVNQNFQGNKRQLSDKLHSLPEGDMLWQRLQGKVYGEYMHQAVCFSGFKTFIKTCALQSNIELFIVSHKTEFGHFDDKKINLRMAAKNWLLQEKLLGDSASLIAEKNLFFESTREEKIARIRTLQCTHFIDDLVEVLNAPQFPVSVKKMWFNPMANNADTDQTIEQFHQYSDWTSIQYALFK
ncbi:MAG: hypothetical protein NXI01_03885 [Gammaproteobacteria bacterium]|nr:hypothetical protein [Gammaproteobacteria bacterium]